MFKVEVPIGVMQEQQAMKDNPRRPTTPETLPGTVSSCSLEDIASSLAVQVQVDQQQQQQQLNDAAHASIPVSPNVGTASRNAPSSVCQQRKLSAAIVTTPDSAKHNLANGRPTVTVESLATAAPGNTNSSNGNNSSNGKERRESISDLNMLTTPTKQFNNPRFQSYNTSTSKSHQSCSNIPTIYDTPPPLPRPIASSHQHRGVSSSAPRRHRDTSIGSNVNHRESSGSSSGHHHKSLTRQNSAPSYNLYSGLINDPHGLRVDAWAEAPGNIYSVRGANYMTDRNKELSDDSLFNLLAVDVVHTANGRPIVGGFCNHPNERIQKALRREMETGDKELPEFIFCVNLAVPGPPFFHIVIYFGCDDMEALQDLDTPIGRLAKPFFFGPCDDYRDSTFKLIPRIVDGNFVVKKTVGSKPTILGRKLKQYYVRDAKNSRFMELIVDIESDAIAKRVVGLCLGYAKTIITDVMFVLEGNSEETLPERILGGVRLKNLDFKKRDGQRKVAQYKA